MGHRCLRLEFEPPKSMVRKLSGGCVQSAIIVRQKYCQIIAAPAKAPGPTGEFLAKAPSTQSGPAIVLPHNPDAPLIAFGFRVF